MNPHNTHFKWSLTSLLRTCICLLETAHSRNTIQSTQTYTTAYSTSQTYQPECHLHQVSPQCLTHYTNGHSGLSSDHLPIITTISIRHDHRQNRRTFTNYEKADWTQYTEDTESAFAQTTKHTNIHTANRIFTNIILMADKHNMPKGKMHSNCRQSHKETKHM